MHNFAKNSDFKIEWGGSLVKLDRVNEKSLNIGTNKMLRFAILLLSVSLTANLASASVLFDITNLAPYTPAQGAPGGNWNNGATSGVLIDSIGGTTIPVTATFTFTGGPFIQETSPDLQPPGAGLPASTPYVSNQNIAGGFENSGFDNTLNTRTDFNTSNGSEFIKLQIDFSTPVENLSFSLGDVDTGGFDPVSGVHNLWQDVVVITGSNGATAASAPALASMGSAVSSLTSGNDLTVYGSSGDVPVSGVNLANGLTNTDGNANVQFSGFVDSIMITYTAGGTSDAVPGNGPANPASQFIMLHDLSATVPEVSSFAMTAIPLCLVWLGNLFVRRRRKSSEV